MQVGHEFVGLGRPLYAPQQFALRVEDQVERDRPASVAFEQFLARGFVYVLFGGYEMLFHEIPHVLA